MGTSETGMSITYSSGRHTVQVLGHCNCYHDDEVMVENHLPSIVFRPLQSTVNTQAWISRVSSGYSSA